MIIAHLAKQVGQMKVTYIITQPLAILNALIHVLMVTSKTLLNILVIFATLTVPPAEQLLIIATPVKLALDGIIFIAYCPA